MPSDRARSEHGISVCPICRSVCLRFEWQSLTAGQHAVARPPRVMPSDHPTDEVVDHLRCQPRAVCAGRRRQREVHHPLRRQLGSPPAPVGEERAVETSGGGGSGRTSGVGRTAPGRVTPPISVPVLWRAHQRARRLKRRAGTLELREAEPDALLAAAAHVGLRAGDHRPVTATSLGGGAIRRQVGRAIADEPLCHPTAVDVLGRVTDGLPALGEVGEIEDEAHRRWEAVACCVLAGVGEARVGDRAARADEGAHAGVPDGRHRAGDARPGEALSETLSLTSAEQAVGFVRLVEPLGRTGGGYQRQRTARDLQIFASGPPRAVELKEIDERSAARTVDGSCGGEKEGERLKPPPPHVEPRACCGCGAEAERSRRAKRKVGSRALLADRQTDKRASRVDSRKQSWRARNIRLRDIRFSGEVLL
eukprot:scaffold11490_cov67-Phaeocystis_antarctica.AAC.7